MSDVEIEILTAIKHLRKEIQTVTVEAVQQLLKSNPFFKDKGIETIPTEWIEPLLTDSDNILSDSPSTTMPELPIGEQVRVINTSFIGTVEVMHINFEDSGFTAYSIRMPRKAIEEGFDDLEIIDERLLTPAYSYTIGQTVYIGEGSTIPFTVIERTIHDSVASYHVKNTRNDNHFWLYERDLTLTPMEMWLEGLSEPTQLVECPTCHASIRPDQRLNDEPDGVCDICANMSVGFSFAETQNTFYAVMAKWHQDTYKPTQCTVFYRTHTQNRIPGYAYAVYQQPNELDKGVYGNITFVAFVQELDTMFQKLKSIGCGVVTEWKNLSRDDFYHHMTKSDCNMLWQAKAYGVLREVGIFDPTPEPDLSFLEDHPF